MALAIVGAGRGARLLGRMSLRGWAHGDGGFELVASAAVAYGGECGQEHEGGKEGEHAFRGGASGVGRVEEHGKWKRVEGGDGMLESGLADLNIKAS